jgi:putative MATE family efflux protein
MANLEVSRTAVPRSGYSCYGAGCMPALVRDRSRVPLVELVWPILVENVLRTSVMSVDTLMLSHYSEKAVAAMSLVNQFAFFIMLVYTMVSAGASILISQYLGAGRQREAGLVGVASLALVTGISLILSLLVVMSSGPLLGVYDLDPQVAGYAGQFLTIYGGLSCFMAFNIAQSSILRAFGYTRGPMLINVLGISLTAAGNALCLFGWFGFPVLGVAGVAGSTVFSQMVACLLYAVLIRSKRDIEVPLGELARVPGRIYRAVLAIGIPTAGENLSYNLSQIAILSLVARLGTEALAAYGILLAVLRYVFMPGVSIGIGTQIKVGYWVGAGQGDEAAGRVYRYLGAGLSCSVLFLLLISSAQSWIFGLFSATPAVLGLAASVFTVALVHEPARNVNTIVIPALKGAGDVRFPVYLGILSMWGVSVFGAWVLGIRLGLGLVGVWIAMASDEWLRGLVVLWRWRSGAWRSKALVPAVDMTAAASTLSAVEQSEGL